VKPLIRFVKTPLDCHWKNEQVRHVLFSLVVSKHAGLGSEEVRRRERSRGFAKRTNSGGGSCALAAVFAGASGLALVLTLNLVGKEISAMCSGSSLLWAARPRAQHAQAEA
jgi:hypothetical protein